MSCPYISNPRCLPPLLLICNAHYCTERVQESLKQQHNVSDPDDIEVRGYCSPRFRRKNPSKVNNYHTYGRPYNIGSCRTKTGQKTFFLVVYGKVGFLYNICSQRNQQHRQFCCKSVSQYYREKPNRPNPTFPSLLLFSSP